MAIIEVTSEFDTEFVQRGVCVVYHDGVEVSAHKTFHEAMRAAFPDYQPWSGHGPEDLLDNM